MIYEVNLTDNLRISIDKPIVKSQFRDVCIVNVRQGDNLIASQPYYKSTGINSNNQGRWFPFSGLDYKVRNGVQTIEPVFHKANFINPNFSKDDIRHRLGNSEKYPEHVLIILAEISDLLTNVKLPDGSYIRDDLLNSYLDTAESAVLENRRKNQEFKLSPKLTSEAKVY